MLCLLPLISAALADDIAVAARDIPFGATVQRADVRTRPAFPDESGPSPRDVIGRLAWATTYAGETFRTERLAPAGTSPRDALVGLGRDTWPYPGAVSPFVQSGDYVDVIVTNANCTVNTLQVWVVSRGDVQLIGTEETVAWLNDGRRRAYVVLRNPSDTGIDPDLPNPCPVGSP